MSQTFAETSSCTGIIQKYFYSMIYQHFGCREFISGCLLEKKKFYHKSTLWQIMFWKISVLATICLVKYILVLLISQTYWVAMPLKEVIFRKNWTCNSFTGTIQSNNSRKRFWRKTVFCYKKPLAAASDYCNVGHVHWVQKPGIVIQKIFEQEKQPTFTSISLKCIKNQPWKIISCVLFTVWINMYSMAIGKRFPNVGTLAMVFSFHFLSDAFASRIRFLFKMERPSTLFKDSR